MQVFKISENDSNQRLDKFLLKLLKNASMWSIFKFLRTWKIKINWKKQEASYRLQLDDEVKVFLLDEDLNDFRSEKEGKNRVGKENILSLLDIAYEDEDLLIINKDAWINVHPADHKSDEISVIEAVHDFLWDKYNSLTFKPSLCHRIDRDTSWILVIAKSKDMLTKLVDDFKNHNNIKKTYTAITIWKFSRKEGTIKKKILRLENAKNENKVQISESWLEATTHYKVLDEIFMELPKQNVVISVVEVVIETWRMHQIRVHLASLWNPIVWDNAYWDKLLNTYFKNNYWLTRQALHSSKLDFFHYKKNKKMVVEARLKDDLKEFLKKIKK